MTYRRLVNAAHIVILFPFLFYIISNKCDINEYLSYALILLICTMVIYHIYIFFYVAGNNENFTDQQRPIYVTINNNGPDQTTVNMVSLDVVTWINKSKYTCVIREPALTANLCPDARNYPNSRTYTLKPGESKKTPIPGCPTTLVYTCVMNDNSYPVTIVPKAVNNI